MKRCGRRSGSTALQRKCCSTAIFPPAGFRCFAPKPADDAHEQLQCPSSALLIFIRQREEIDMPEVQRRTACRHESAAPRRPADHFGKRERALLAGGAGPNLEHRRLHFAVLRSQLPIGAALNDAIAGTLERSEEHTSELQSRVDLV